MIVTGSNGYLGKHLVTHLRALGYDPYCVPSKAYDLRRPAHIEALFKHTGKPDIIFHLAANVGGIQYNIDNPGAIFYDNVMMTTQLIHQAMIHGCGKFVMIGTACSYPEYNPLPTGEDRLWQGYPEPTNGAYGVAKLIALTQLQAYQKQYGMNFAYLVLANLYGPGDAGFFNPEKSHLIPSLIKQFGSNPSQVMLSGNGKLTRDLLYVDDAAIALTRLLDIDYNEPINIATGKEHSKSEIVKIVASLFDYKGNVIFDSSIDRGQLYRQYDTKKAGKILDWHYKTDLKEGLERTVRWYKDTFLN